MIKDVIIAFLPIKNLFFMTISLQGVFFDKYFFEEKIFVKKRTL